MYMVHVCFYLCCSDCVGVCGNVCCVAALFNDCLKKYIVKNLQHHYYVYFSLFNGSTFKLLKFATLEMP